MKTLNKYILYIIFFFFFFYILKLFRVSRNNLFVFDRQLYYFLKIQQKSIFKNEQNIIFQLINLNIIKNILNYYDSVCYKRVHCELSLKLNFNHSEYNFSPNIYFLPISFLLQITLEYTSIFHSKYYRTSLVNDLSL